MEGKVTEQGHFELFISERGHRLLMLNDNAWYRWEWNSPVQKLYLTKGVVDKSGDKDYTAQRQGRYYLVESISGEHKGFQYMLLENDIFFDIYRLPNGLPSSMDYESEIVDMHEKVPAENVDTNFYQIKN